jgi:hypothetical protein
VNQQLKTLSPGMTVRIDDGPPRRLKVVHFCFEYLDGYPACFKDFVPSTKLVVLCLHEGQRAGKYCQECGELL